MRLQLHQVKVWGIGYQSIGHIVMSNNDGWYFTACRSLTPNLDIQERKPDRICRRCRKELPNLKQASPDDARSEHGT